MKKSILLHTLQDIQQPPGWNEGIQGPSCTHDPACKKSGMGIPYFTHNLSAVSFHFSGGQVHFTSCVLWLLPSRVSSTWMWMMPQLYVSCLSILSLPLHYIGDFMAKTIWQGGKKFCVLWGCIGIYQTLHSC